MKDTRIDVGPYLTRPLLEIWGACEAVAAEVRDELQTYH